MKAIFNTIKEFKHISWPTLRESFSKTFVVVIFGLILGIVSTIISLVFIPLFK